MGMGFVAGRPRAELLGKKGPTGSWLPPAAEKFGIAAFEPLASAHGVI